MKRSTIDNIFTVITLIFGISAIVFCGLWLKEKGRAKFLEDLNNFSKLEYNARTDTTLTISGTSFILYDNPTDAPVKFKIDNQKYSIGGLVKNRTNTITTFKSIDGKEFDYHGVFKDTYVTVDAKEFLIKSEDLNKNFLKHEPTLKWEILIPSHTNQFFLYDPNYQWTISSNIIKSIRKPE